MDIHTGNVPSQMHPAVAVPAAGEQQGFDIVRVLWRWKFLPILGTLIGMALGYLYYTRQPPQYMASALLQVVTPVSASSRVQPYNPGDVMQVSRQDESLVIASETVLNMAGEKLVKNKHPTLEGMDSRQIAAWISGERRLSVTPGIEDAANTTLISIDFVCEDQDLSAMVVNAIVEGYSDYLSQEYRTVGEEVYKIMTEAQEKVAKSFVELREKNQKAREAIDMPIVWTSEGAVNPYTTNLQSLNTRLADLQMERTLLQSKLEHATAALKSERDPEAILLWLADSEHVNLPPGSVMNNLEYKLATQQHESDRLEREDLFKLKIEEQRYLNTVGESHPALASIRKQIELLQKQIGKVREAERARDADLMAKFSDKKGEEGEEPAFKPLTASERLTTRLNSMQEALASLQLEEQGLQELMRTNEDASKKLAKAIQDVELSDRELALVETLQSALIEKLKQLELGPTGSQRSLKELNLPGNGYFYGPKLPPYLLGGGAIGFMLLAGLAVLLDLADKSFRSPEDIAAEVGAPVLGHIPAMELDKVIKKPNQAVDGSLCTIHHSRGRVSEAYRGIRTGLFFSNRTGDLKVIQVTSPVPGDGKSTLSANLAVTMAQSGRSVLLIDADFRRPRIAKLFSIDSDKGMATVVAGACELDEAIHQSPVPFLSVMPGGKRPSNPAELLSSQRFADLVGVLREKFDIIVIDTPPLLAVSDPGAVAAIVDGVVLTIRLRRNVKPLVTRAAKVLESVDANLLGIVVNGVSQDAGHGYNYGYRDYRYAYQNRYGYGYKNYGYGGDNYGAKRYLEEPHDINTDHVLVEERDS